ncbi:MAG TPA: DMT family transporter [Leucothrix mucor]|uniref:DMT family transporter n=1 Tax=Leucothrix mucor TaxID=45248 RepID=A0A7V2WVJ1_LEUMU|nr:DMT family transporter [Leucothrix mucor]
MKPYFILLLPPLFWAGNFIAGRAIADQASPISLSFWRWALALIIILPFIIKPILQQWGIIKQNLGVLLLLAVLSVTAFNSLAYIGLQYTTATNGTLLNSFIPIFILIISSLFFNESINFRQTMGVMISLLGVLIILSKLDIAVIKQLSFNKGDLWILAGSLDWAIYSILLKRYRPTKLSALSFLGSTMIVGLLFLLPIYLLNPFDEVGLLINQASILTLLYIALFPSIFAYLAWNYGISKVGASIGGQYIHLMPLFGALLAVIFLGEQIRLYHLLGGFAIGIGLWLSIQ